MGEGRDAERVRALLRLQHPDLAGRSLRRLPEATGGSELWRLGDDLAVRLPRTPEAAERLCRAHRWLPALAPTLPLAVPVPRRIGLPSALFPRHWTVVQWIAGEPAKVIPDDRRSIDLLAEFLRALHVEPHPEAAGGPHWIHGNLRPGALLMTEGRLSGVVGFGELRAGDPAVDLAALCRGLPDRAASRLLAAYGADDETVARSAGLI